MKQLKSSLHDLRQLFERSLAARDLAEPLVSFDNTQLADGVRAFMERKDKDYDVVGVRSHGLVTGYVQRSALTTGTLADHLLPFDEGIILHEASPAVEALRRLAVSPRVFVARGPHPWGIIARGDLQKAPIRMCLFGLVSLLEMQFLKLIRDFHPDEEWRGLVSPPRLEEAARILEDRRRRNEGTDLADCLQFADKAAIIAKSERLRSGLGFQSRTKAESLLKELENLRNDLAHAQNIIVGRWPRLVELAQEAETLLERCENIGEAGQVPA